MSASIVGRSVIPWKSVGRLVALRSAFMALVIAGAAVPLAAQETARVSGSVVHAASGAPLAGARVVVDRSTVRAVTNSEGRYTLVGLRPGSHTIRVTLIGFAAGAEQVTIGAGQTETVDFRLATQAVTLSEVVVTGYGERNRRELSTAVGSVSGAQIQNQPVAGLDAAMQGKVAGVQVVQNAGNPGVGITVRVRGSASLSASNQPLYVIDGVPMLRENYSQLGLGGQDVTAVTGISPDEIESLDVLKDASAAAIYGSRASNGVIMITTKRGRAGAPRFEVSAYTGRQRAGKTVDLLNAEEYIEYMAEGAVNDGYDPADWGLEVGVNDQVNTDWQRAILRTAPVSNVHLGVGGGSDRVRYYVSGGYFNQEGILFGSGYNRASARANMDFIATDRFSVRTSVGLTREDNDRVENDNSIFAVFGNALANPPNVAVRREDGEFTSIEDGLQYANPLALGTLNSVEARTLRALGSLEATLNLTDRLRLNSRLGLDVLNLRDLEWQSPKVLDQYAASVAGVAQQGNTTATKYLAESYLSFDRAVSGVSDISLTAGASAEFNSSEDDFLRGEGFGNEAFRYVGNAGKVTSYDGGKTGNNLVSMFSRGVFALRDKYFFTASLRADGSSRFGENNRFGLFPAVSMGWALTDEPFFSGMNRFATLKLRASYGVTGNQGIGDDFAPLPRFARANYSDEPGIAPSSIGNPDLKWETTRETNLGFDLTMLSGRLTWVGDWYRKKTEDLLVTRPITSTSGSTSFWDNVGNIENKGFELALNAILLEPAAPTGFRWTSDVNVSWNQNKVLKLYNGEPFNTNIRSVSRVEEGQPLGYFHAVRFDGVDPATGDAIYFDANGDGRVNADDRINVGSPHPDYWGGWNNTLSWRGLDLRGFLQFSQGGEIFNLVRIFADDGGYYYDNKVRGVLRRWQKPGDITDQPRASFDGVSGARTVSSRFVEDGSYVRLQELTLAYGLPSFLSRVGNLQNAKMYISGRNLKTWTDFSWYNPDVNSNGSDANISLGTEFYSYPLARTITFGITGAW